MGSKIVPRGCTGSETKVCIIFFLFRIARRLISSFPPLSFSVSCAISPRKRKLAKKRETKAPQSNGVGLEAANLGLGVKRDTKERQRSRRRDETKKKMQWTLKEQKKGTGLHHVWFLILYAFVSADRPNFIFFRNRQLNWYVWIHASFLSLCFPQLKIFLLSPIFPLIGRTLHVAYQARFEVDLYVF